MTMQREWFEKDYYAALGVAPDATQKDITAAYRRLARQYHPDANPGDADAEEQFKEVSSAYDVIGDPESRKSYNDLRALGSRFTGAGTGPGAGFGRPGQPGFDPSDVGDLLNNMFGRGERRGRGAGGPFSRGPQRGADLETELHLSFLDAIRGISTSVNLYSDATCGACHGTCAEAGTSPRVCADCDGRGVIDDNQGFFSLSHPCATCGGRGSIIDTACSVCSGTGIVARPRSVTVTLPEGVRDGQKVRLKGKGSPGRNGGPDGDLYVRVDIEPHHQFARDGEDLVLTVPITFVEATLGADIRVPTLDAEPVTIRIPPGTPTGRVFRVKGRGVCTPTESGDLLVAVEVAVPTTISAEERRALESLRSAATSSPRSYLGID